MGCVKSKNISQAENNYQPEIEQEKNRMTFEDAPFQFKSFLLAADKGYKPLTMERYTNIHHGVKLKI